MNIGIYTEDLPPHFRWSLKTAWRGTEEFYVETARAMARAGHQVTVYYDGPAAEDPIPGCMITPVYRPRAEYRGGHDAVLCCNGAPGVRTPGTRHVYWTNLYGDRIERHLWADDHITISDFAARDYGVIRADNEPEDSPPLAWAKVIGHGVDAVKYAPLPKEPIALYSSSMDRGGHWLKAKWDSFGMKMPESLGGAPIRLVCSEGKMSDAELTDTYRRAALWLHPGMGVELFCLSALKARAAGCLCLYSPIMALPQTIGPGHVALGALYWPRRGAADVAAALQRGAYAPTEPLPSWDDVTAVIAEVLRGPVQTR